MLPLPSVYSEMIAQGGIVPPPGPAYPCASAYVASASSAAGPTYDTASSCAIVENGRSSSVPGIPSAPSRCVTMFSAARRSSATSTSSTSNVVARSLTSASVAASRASALSAIHPPARAKSSSRCSADGPTYGTVSSSTTERNGRSSAVPSASSAPLRQSTMLVAARRSSATSTSSISTVVSLSFTSANMPSSSALPGSTSGKARSPESSSRGPAVQPSVAPRSSTHARLPK